VDEQNLRCVWFWTSQTLESRDWLLSWGMYECSQFSVLHLHMQVQISSALEWARGSNSW